MAITVDDFRDSTGKWLKGYSIDKVRYITKSCQLWNHIRARCKVGGQFQKRKPSYEGCFMSDGFKDFQTFAEWKNSQTGNNVVGYQLDKDILLHGNREYGEATCVFIPQKLNTFLTHRKNSKRVLPIGVRRFGDSYAAICSTDAESRYVGLFRTVEEAFSEYCVTKDSQARAWATTLCSPEYDVDPRVINAMLEWSVKERIS